MNRLMVGCAVSVVLSAACVSRDAGTKLLSEGCVINSDCAAPLICAFRVCHNACTSDRDCPAGLSCRSVDRPYNVCLLPTEQSCEAADGGANFSKCPTPLQCGVDLQCRNVCVVDSDCVADQVCVSGSCANPSEVIGAKLKNARTTMLGSLCSTSADCNASGFVCRAGRCAFECTDDGDCATGRCMNHRCEPANTGGSSGAGGGVGGGSTGGGVGGGSTGGGVGGGSTGGGVGGGSTGGGVGGGSTGGGVGGGSTGGGVGGGSTGGGVGGGSTGGGVGGGSMMFDAGPAPTARITPQPFVIAPNSGDQQIYGVQSTGAQPLQYAWSSDAGLTFSPSSGYFAAVSTFTTPRDAGHFGVSLTVTDPFGRTSTTSGEVVVASPPRAIITATMGTGLTLDGGLLSVGSNFALGLTAAQSTDPNNLPLTYAWRQSGGPTVMIAGATQRDAIFTMPFVMTRSLVSLELVVSNAFGLTSAPATLHVSVEPNASAMWAIDAGPTRSVDAGTLVVLSASVASPGAPASAFSYDWQPRSGTGWVLNNADTATPAFISPTADGTPVLLPFTLTVTNDAGLTPPSLVTNVLIQVPDTAPPRVVRTSIRNGIGSRMWIEIEFSEPMQLSDPNYVPIVGGPSTVFSTAEVINNRIIVRPNVPLLEGTFYTLRVNGPANLAAWKDLATPANAATPTDVPFVASTVTGPLFVSAELDSMVEPRPAIAPLLRLDEYPAASVAPMVQLIGHGAANALYLTTPFDLSSCASPPCTTTSAAITQPSTPFVATANRSRRGVIGPNGPVALLQFRGPSQLGVAYQGNPRDGGWTPLPEPLGALFADQQGLFTVGLDQGLKTRRLDQGTWVAHETLSTNLADYPDSGVPLITATTENINPVYRLVSTITASGTLHTWLENVTPFTNVNTTSATNITGTGCTAIDSRSISNGTSFNLAGVCRGATGQFTSWFGQFNTSSATSAQRMANTSMSIDVRKGQGNYSMMVAEEAGDVRLLYRDGTTGSVLVLTATPLNAPGCVAAAPELEYFGPRLLVVWQERCSGGTGPWRMAARLID